MQERAKQTQAKILKAARTLFAKSGFHGTRVDAIANKAGVNKERIYAYYTNKEGLFASVLRDAFEAIVREEQALQDLSEEDIPQLTHLLMDHYTAFHQKHPHFWRLVSWENLEGGKHVAALRGIKEPAFQHLRRLYQTGQASGIYDNGVSFEAYMFIVSALCFFYFSNQQTMTQTLQLDLADAQTRERLLGEVIQALAFQGVVKR